MTLEGDLVLASGGIIRGDPGTPFVPAPPDDVLVDNRLARVGSEPLVDADNIPTG